MIKTKERELKQIYAMVVIVFLVFLLIPIVLLLGKSFDRQSNRHVFHR